MPVPPREICERILEGWKEYDCMVSQILRSGMNFQHAASIPPLLQRPAQDRYNFRESRHNPFRISCPEIQHNPLPGPDILPATPVSTPHFIAEPRRMESAVPALSGDASTSAVGVITLDIDETWLKNKYNPVRRYISCRNKYGTHRPPKRSYKDYANERGGASFLGGNTSDSRYVFPSHIILNKHVSEKRWLGVQLACAEATTLMETSMRASLGADCRCGPIKCYRGNDSTGKAWNTKVITWHWFCFLW